MQQYPEIIRNMLDRIEILEAKVDQLRKDAALAACPTPPPEVGK
jgi:hypothetical protein